MARIENAIQDLGKLDLLAQQRTMVHCLDPRAKLLATLAFIATVASFGKYEVAALAPFAAYPLALAVAGQVPMAALARYIACACPFAILVGIFNPLFDRQTMLQVGGTAISGGWLSFASIFCRFLLAVSTAFVLVATTGFNVICSSLARLGLPRLLTAQMLMLYRYIFLLSHEANRMRRAYDLRAVDGRRMAIRAYSSLISLLLLRAYARGERIHVAMLCRGFDGEMPMPAQASHFSLGSAIFLIASLVYFGGMRFWPLSRYLGEALLGAKG